MSSNYPPSPASGQTPPTGEPGQTPPNQQHLPNNPPQPTPQQVPPPSSGQTPPIPTGDPQQHNTRSISEFPSDAQELIKALRKESKQNREALEALQQREHAAEQERLRAAGQFQTLAEQATARVKELEPIATRYTALSELVMTQLEAEIKDWPAEVKTFDPGRDAPIEQRLEWRAKSQALVAKMNVAAHGAQPGMGRNPPAGKQPTREELVTANVEAMRRARGRIL